MEQPLTWGEAGPRARESLKHGSEPLLSIRGLSKTFAGTQALSEVNLSVSAGEIVALLGHNGSGKSTLVKVLAGIHRPDEGSEIRVKSEMHFIHQDLGLVTSLNTVENLGLSGVQGWRNLMPIPRRAVSAAQASIARFGGTFDVTVPIARISPAERTIVAIARATSAWSGARNVLVLDEPTATLHGDEAERLRTIVKGMARDGVGILYISHHLSEVVDLADRAVVLRDGAVMTNEQRGSFDEESLVRAISGGKASAQTASSSFRQPGRVRLNVRGLSTERIAGIDLEVRANEIVGVSGLIGSGREELLSCLFGARPVTMTEFEVDGRPVRLTSPYAAIRAGLGYVPADRRGQGAVASLNGRENLTLASLPKLSLRRPMLSVGRERSNALSEMAQVAVRPLDSERRFALFSGGNQQKIVIAKWLRTNPVVMLLDEPSQGIDVAARAGIHELIRTMADTGTGFLVASSDEDELAQLCDRVVVLRDGQIGEELVGHRLTKDNLLRASLTRLKTPLE